MDFREHARRYVDDDTELDSFVERVRARLAWRIEHGYKTCSRCGLNKKPGEFGANARRRDGLHYTCLECERAQRR